MREAKTMRRRPAIKKPDAGRKVTAKQRKGVKRKIAGIADDLVSAGFNEAFRISSIEGCPRSSLDLCRWFVDAFNERLDRIPYVKRGEG